MPDTAPGSRRRPDVLAYAALRERTVDEHNYAVDARRRGTFRLQLFTAAGARPVAIATQRYTEKISEGTSLSNAAECYAETVWQQHFPDQAEPPIWIQLQLVDEERNEDLGPLGDGFEAVTFTVDAERRPSRLHSPTWEPLEYDEVAELVGREVDVTRGRDWNPPEPEPEEKFYFRVAAVVSLPPTMPFRQPDCMPCTNEHSWRIGRRLLRQLRPRREALECCWYHGGDWHQVSRVAIGLVRAGQKAGVDAPDLWGWAHDQNLLGGLDRWQTQALESLLGMALAIQPFEDHTMYTNGQHRAQAMLDQGVRRTVVGNWRWPGQ
jgi:hypothetical protein